MSTLVVAPGWAESGRPPRAPGGGESAPAAPGGCCPPDFRGYRVLRHHPLVLAQFAEQFVEGQCRAVQEGRAAVRTTLKGEVRPDIVETAAEIWLEQGAALMRTRRAVGLIAQALRGRTFLARL